MKRVLKAVLFDWGDTLMRWEWRDDLLEAGHRSGLAAIGRSAPEAHALAAHFREAYLPLLWQPGMLEEVEYPELVRDLLADFEIEIADAELNAFLEAEHAAWNPARQLGPATPALLDGLRERGLVLGLVSNAMDPPWLLHCDLEQMKVAERLDVAVFSSEVGKRKPHQEIFRRALDPLDVSADEALFVGDRLYEDVRGAAEVGMKTVQALWFRTDKHPSGVDPDFQALSPLDVLDVAERLLVRT